ncbi:hypothetical protein PHMEG_00029944, partial [Phytophthora megakarya]
NRFPPKNEGKLHIIVYMPDIWRLHLGPTTPAKVSFEKCSTQLMCKGRAYPPLHIRNFLRGFNGKLVRLEREYETSSW